MDRIGDVRVQGREDREGPCQVCLGGCHAALLLSLRIIQ
jgi:hypothetical protein